ncbi:MAG: MBL fold metallo-hydrolase [Desulfobacterales bacterium]|nr:MAG: MBL fold metallo-hydrolase [Desulfobacterales bacterium]
MIDISQFQNIQGILTILAEEPNWPNPANIYAIPDEKGFSLIDVGCGGASSIEHLQDGLRHWQLKIEQLHTVVLSHAHPDHMGAMWWILEEANPMIIIHHLDAAAALDPIKLEESFDIPLAKQRWAASTGENTLQSFVLLKFFEDSTCPMSAARKVEEIHEGDTLQLGNFEFEVVHTPGHSPGHISLYDRKKRILLPGDLVGKAPAWYVPTAGGVIGYLDSLAKLKTLDAAVLLPAHGPIFEDATRAIWKIQKKLLQRESIIKEALQDGAKSYLELNKRFLGNSHLNFFPGCGIIESHLIKMEREGIIERKGQQVVSLIT